jgi:hypothetical protein
MDGDTWVPEACSTSSGSSTAISTTARKHIIRANHVLLQEKCYHFAVTLLY